MLGPLATMLWVAASASGDLEVLAKQSGRPGSCQSTPAAEAAANAPASRFDAWDQIRSAGRSQFCQRLALIHLNLASAPEAALRLAEELTRTAPAEPEPWALAAQARVESGEYAEGWSLFGTAREHGYDVRAPRMLHAYALAAALTEHGEVAVQSYRALFRLLDAWPDPIDRQRIVLEAAAAALRTGPSGVAEAAGYIASVRANATSTGLRAFAAALEALVAQRRGQPLTRESQVDATEVWYLVAQVRGEHRPPHWPVLPLGEAAAAASLAVEPYSSVEALELWRRHAEALEHSNAESAWRELTARRLRALENAGRRVP
jgi:hypothetical protein